MCQKTSLGARSVPLSEPMLACCFLNLSFEKFESNCNNFHARKLIRIGLLQHDAQFVSAWVCFSRSPLNANNVSSIKHHCQKCQWNLTKYYEASKTNEAEPYFFYRHVWYNKNCRRLTFDVFCYGLVWVVLISIFQNYWFTQGCQGQFIIPMCHQNDGYRYT